MRLKYNIIFYVLLIIFAITCSAVAVQIELGDSSIELVSGVDNYAYRTMPETMYIQGLYQINLKGIGEKSQLEIYFQADDPEVYALMASQIQLQYYIQSDEMEGQWSEWITLNRLPLFILFRDQGLHLSTDLLRDKYSPDEVVVLLRFRVPQSMQLRHGVFNGEFIFKIS